MTLTLQTLEPFARGGNRLCFVHPDFPDRVIKVRRPDFSLEERRRRKGFPKNLRPLSSFDDSAEENRVMRALDQQFGEPLYQHVSRCYGFEDSDMGPGLVSELVRDASGRIAHTLKQYIWENGYDDNARAAVTAFCAHWESLGVPSRDLLLHNLVAQCNAQGIITRLVVIDGLGSAGVIPPRFLPINYLRYKARRKITDLHQRIKQLLSQRGQEQFPGYHGLLFHDGVSPSKPADTAPQNRPTR
ncbi:MAG TPA: YrbL family protein [Dongiaceae bacterium]|nr:YrbL family protein [Dongiaceae bacterium]